MNQQKWITDLMDITKMSIETGMRTMDVFQQQTQKAVELSTYNSTVIQTESQKAFQTWMNNINIAQKIYTDALEEGIQLWENLPIGTTNTKKKQ